MKRNYLVTALALATLALGPVHATAQDAATPSHKAKHHKYRLVDLGTFGGPASYFTFLQQPINSVGTVVGGADTSIADPYSPNCFNLDCFASHAFQMKEGVVTDLGTVAGGYSSFAEWINNRGWIVGISQNGTIDPIFGTPAIHGVLWKNGDIIDLGTLGGASSTAFGVNSKGQVTGVTANAIPDPFSFAGPGGTQLRAYLWQRGTMHDIGTLGGPDAFGQYINERGQVVGFSYINYIPNLSTGVPTVDPFLWENGRMHDLGNFGGTFGQVNILNNAGDVVGTMNLAGDVNVHGFIWRHGSLIDPGTFGGNNSAANWINEAGDVVGVADFPGDQLHDAFLWRNGRLTDLGNLGITSSAVGINSERQIVGASRIDAAPGNNRAFLWEKSGPMVDLNDLIPSRSSLMLVDALYVSERGEIAGLGTPAGCAPADVESCGHAFVLLPDGDCDADNETRITASRARAEQVRLSGEMPTPQPRLSPVEKIRNIMRRSYHLPGQASEAHD